MAKEVRRDGVSVMKEIVAGNRRLKMLYIETPIKADIVAEALATTLCRHLVDVRWVGV